VTQKPELGDTGDTSVWVAKRNCRSLHFGRDDKGKMDCLPKCPFGEKQSQIPRLRSGGNLFGFIAVTPYTNSRQEPSS
jgi:hypothetical protein